MELMKKQIREGQYKYPHDLVKLKPTKHYLARLEERGIGLECMPTLVRVTENNLHSAKTNDGVHLHSVVVKLDYNYNRWLFLCLNPYDGGVKSMWFRDKTKRYANRWNKVNERDSKQTI